MTLSRCFGWAFALMVVSLMAVVGLFHEGSRRSVLATSERRMAQTSRQLVEVISRHLAEAEAAVASLERRAGAGLLALGDPRAVETALLGELLAREDLTEVTFTGAGGQLSAQRLGPGPGSEILLRRVLPAAAGSAGVGWRAERRRLNAAGAAAAPPVTESLPASDPTAHDTYRTPARPELRGQALWSDLAYAQQDAGRPEAEQRRVVTVQKGLWSAAGDLEGVLRVGLQSDWVDQLARLRVEPGAGHDPHQPFVCDRRGRLITRLGPGDSFALLDDRGQPDAEDGDVRVRPAALRPEVRAALALPALAALMPGASLVERLAPGGPATLVSFSALPEGRTLGWVVGLVVPEQHYLGPLDAARRRLLLVAGLLVLVAAVGGAAALGRFRRGLARVVGETDRLRAFDFSPAPLSPGGFRDVAAVVDSLEQAKTALRALTRYVPLQLVRQLYQARREPVLGARLQEASILFSDIEGFTTVSEQMGPDALATALGTYLEVCTGAIHAASGTVDKYTGDGIMALWNTPQSCPEHAALACEGALRCQEALETLYRSPAWAGLPRWKTRFGIHRAQVAVGHFGAPDRLSFTAMGDGVNLASRLEGLNKQYGTGILVSAAVQQVAAGAFRFRRVDEVAVRGKRAAVEVFELLGRRRG